jgi:hypothetical protein
VSEDSLDGQNRADARIEEEVFGGEGAVLHRGKALGDHVPHDRRKGARRAGSGRKEVGGTPSEGMRSDGGRDWDASSMHANGQRDPITHLPGESAEGVEDIVDGLIERAEQGRGASGSGGTPEKKGRRHGSHEMIDEAHTRTVAQEHGLQTEIVETGERTSASGRILHDTLHLRLNKRHISRHRDSHERLIVTDTQTRSRRHKLRDSFANLLPCPIRHDNRLFNIDDAPDRCQLPLRHLKHHPQLGRGSEQVDVIGKGSLHALYLMVVSKDTVDAELRRYESSQTESHGHGTPLPQPTRLLHPGQTPATPKAPPRHPPMAKFEQREDAAKPKRDSSAHHRLTENRIVAIDEIQRKHTEAIVGLEEGGGEKRDDSACILPPNRKVKGNESALKLRAKTLRHHLLHHPHQDLAANDRANLT